MTTNKRTPFVGQGSAALVAKRPVSDRELVQADAKRLEILLSAVSSVLRGTGAIADLTAAERMDWQGGGEVIVDAKIAVSRLRTDNIDVQAIRAAVEGYAPNKATIDRMQKEIDELRKDPDQREIARLRQTVALLEGEKVSLERRVSSAEARIAAAEARTAPVAANTRIAALESEIVNLRKQLNVAPPAEHDDRDPTATRMSLLELT